MAELDYVRLAAACHCGEPVKLWAGRGRPPLYCEEHARPAKKATEQKECPACRGFFMPHGNGGQEQKYCSRTCAVRFRRGSKPRQMWPLTCRECGAGFQSLVEKAMYCGKRCKMTAWVSANSDKWKARGHGPTLPKVCAVFAGYCETCGAAMVCRRKNRWCSKSCEHKARYVSIAPTHKNCVRCGVLFCVARFKTRPPDFCGDVCRTDAKAAIRRAHKTKRKAAERGVHAEPVDPIKVFERDRWRCQLCGIKTPASKRGSYEPDAPELDHIVPLAQQGEHTYRNVQCACRRCNGSKGAKARGQLLLVG